MSSLATKRWRSAAVSVTLGVVAIGFIYASDGLVAAVVVGLLYVALAWWSWPGRRGRHVDHHVAQAQAADDDVIVYWRPG